VINKYILRLKEEFGFDLTFSFSRYFTVMDKTSVPHSLSFTTPSKSYLMITSARVFQLTSNSCVGRRTLDPRQGLVRERAWL